MKGNVKGIGRVVVVLACATVLAGCRIDADVHVTLRDDGSGTVEATVALDAEAIGRIEANGRTLDDSFPTADLTEGGWEVTGWTREADGGATLHVEHEFADADELTARLRELDGGTVLVGSAIVRERGLFNTRDELTVDVDVRQVGTQILADEELVASLQATGLDVAALDQQLEAELQDALRVIVTVEEPGGRVTTAELTPGEQQSVTAARSDFDMNRLVVMVIGGLLLFLAVLLYLAAGASARRDRRIRSDRVVDRTPLM